jgi:hypothetical protein
MKPSLTPFVCSHPDPFSDIRCSVFVFQSSLLLRLLQMPASIYSGLLLAKRFSAAFLVLSRSRRTLHALPPRMKNRAIVSLTWLLERPSGPPDLKGASLSSSLSRMSVSITSKAGSLVSSFISESSFFSKLTSRLLQTHSVMATNSDSSMQSVPQDLPSR